MDSLDDWQISRGEGWLEPLLIHGLKKLVFQLFIYTFR